MMITAEQAKELLANPIVTIEGPDGIRIEPRMFDAAPDLAQTVIDLTERAEKAEAKLEMPCGSCHPCTEWANQTWINERERLPSVIEWQDMRERAEKAEADRDALRKLSRDPSWLRAKLRAALGGEQP